MWALSLEDVLGRAVITGFFLGGVDLRAPLTLLSSDQLVEALPRFLPNARALTRPATIPYVVGASVSGSEGSAHADTETPSTASDLTAVSIPRRGTGLPTSRRREQYSRRRRLHARAATATCSSPAAPAPANRRCCARSRHARPRAGRRRADRPRRRQRRRPDHPLVLRLAAAPHPPRRHPPQPQRRR